MTFERLVRSEVAHLEGRKLLQTSVTQLLGMTDAASAALQAELRITSIYDLAASALFNMARSLVDAGTMIETEALNHRFVSRDALWLDPDSVNLDTIGAEKITQIVFDPRSQKNSDAIAGRIAKALQIQFIADLALWPPFQNARFILTTTFQTAGVVEDDLEAPTDLIPSTGNYATERVYYFSAFMTRMEDPGKNVVDLSSQDTAIDLDAADDMLYTRPAEGVFLKTEQAWYAQGVTLGQLLHSLALAPGESTKIAMVDWMRRTTGKSGEETIETEAQAGWTQQNRSISEITNAIANETQYGDSSSSSESDSWQNGTTMAFNTLFTSGGKSSGRSGNTGFASSVSRTSGTRDISTNTSQNISASTSQHATASRSHRATVVRESFEQENEKITTRVITNYNHMHAMSVQYYEMVQAYRVKTRSVHFDRVLFLPMKPLLFDVDKVLRYRNILMQVARDEGIQERLKYFQKFAATTLTGKNTSTAGLGGGDMPFPLSAVTYLKLDDKSRQSVNGRLAYVRYVVETPGLVLGLRLVKADGTYEDLPAEKPEISKEGYFRFNPALELADLAEIHLLYNGDARRHVSSTNNGSYGDFMIHFYVREPDGNTSYYHGINLPPQLTVVEPDSPIHWEIPQIAPDPLSGNIVDWLALTIETMQPNYDIVDHLNDNALYYSQAIWAAGDPLLLSRVLSRYTYKDPYRSDTGNSRPLGAYLDPTPVAVTGNYVGFIWHFENEEARLKWMKDNELVEGRDESEIMVSLPSGGVFAEAVLGRFNSAEKLDLSRFWNWQDSPIPILPPDIAPVEAGSRAREIDTTPTQLGSSLIQMPQLQSMPDPTGLAAVTQALTAANMFRDMSGQSETAAALSKSVEMAASASEGSAQQAQNAMQSLMNHQQSLARIASDTFVASRLLPKGSQSAANPSKMGALINSAQRADAMNQRQAAAQPAPQPPTGDGSAPSTPPTPPPLPPDPAKTQPYTTAAYDSVIAELKDVLKKRGKVE
ncbi:MAG: hypothetical protein H6672_03375 [Anaerolineaceae bacterium]|nr:hypothetical protein [Anaerolineaceae bacterium]